MPPLVGEKSEKEKLCLAGMAVSFISRSFFFYFFSLLSHLLFYFFLPLQPPIDDRIQVGEPETACKQRRRVCAGLNGLLPFRLLKGGNRTKEQDLRL